VLSAEPSTWGKNVTPLANRTLNIYVVHQYTAISYIIFSMLTSSANEVWSIYNPLLHQVNFTIRHKVLLSLLVPCPQVFLGTMRLHAFPFVKGRFNKAKNNYLAVELAVRYLRMLHLWNSDLFHEKSVDTLPLGTAVYKLLFQC